MRGRGDFLHFFLHFRFYCGKIGAEPPKNHIYVVSFGVHGTIAQLVEQMTFNHWVQGSSPCGPTTNKKSPNGGVFYLWHGQVDENPWVRHDSWQEQALLRAVRALRVERVPVAAHLCDGWECAVPVVPPLISPPYRRVFFCFFV